MVIKEFLYVEVRDSYLLLRVVQMIDALFKMEISSACVSCNRLVKSLKRFNFFNHNQILSRRWYRIIFCCFFWYRIDKWKYLWIWDLNIVWYFFVLFLFYEFPKKSVLWSRDTREKRNMLVHKTKVWPLFWSLAFSIRSSSWTLALVSWRKGESWPFHKK